MFESLDSIREIKLNLKKQRKEALSEPKVYQSYMDTISLYYFIIEPIQNIRNPSSSENVTSLYTYYCHSLGDSCFASISFLWTQTSNLMSTSPYIFLLFYLHHLSAMHKFKNGNRSAKTQTCERSRITHFRRVILHVGYW